MQGPTRLLSKAALSHRGRFLLLTKAVSCPARGFPCTPPYVRFTLPSRVLMKTENWLTSPSAAPCAPSVPPAPSPAASSCLARAGELFGAQATSLLRRAQHRGHGQRPTSNSVWSENACSFSPKCFVPHLLGLGLSHVPAGADASPGCLVQRQGPSLAAPDGLRGRSSGAGCNHGCRWQ